MRAKPVSKPLPITEVLDRTQPTPSSLNHNLVIHPQFVICVCKCVHLQTTTWAVNRVFCELPRN